MNKYDFSDKTQKQGSFKFLRVYWFFLFPLVYRIWACFVPCHHARIPGRTLVMESFPILEPKSKCIYQHFSEHSGKNNLGKIFTFLDDFLVKERKTPRKLHKFIPFLRLLGFKPNLNQRSFLKGMSCHYGYWATFSFERPHKGDRGFACLSCYK